MMNKFINKKYFLILLCLIIILIILIIFINRNTNNKEKLILFGDNLITLNYGEKYLEPGYYAIDKNGKIDTQNVIIKNNNINTKEPGEYTIIYKYKNIKKERTIKVLENKFEDNLKLSLIGDNNITLELNDKYMELGYNASFNDLDLTNNVLVTSNLNTNKVGIYQIIYTIEYNNIKKELVRNIKVIDNNLYINILYDNNYTNKDIQIEIKIEGNNFNYLLLPDDTIIKEKNTIYKITENGNYTFKAYDTNNKEFENTIEIKNIDKIKPIGNCTATINKNNTIINTDASDNNNIKNYIYLDNGIEINKSNNTTYNYNKKTSNNISVKLIDIANNTNIINCKIIDNSYDKPILPNNNENIIFKGETDTLKAYISKFDDYNLTRIWMYNPYTQTNKFDSPEYGKKLYKPSNLLSKATDKYNLKDKLLIGFNASGFYLKDEYDSASVKRYSAYNKTSVGTLVITNGKVIRNNYSKGDIITWFITGINKENKMLIFEDTKISSTTASKKKEWATKVINSGIRNTYTFASPVIIDGKKTNYTNKNSRMPSSNSSEIGLQLLCQINSNNFVLFTGKSTRNKAINKFLELGCQTAVNLDGGGSIALLYKEKGTTKINVVRGNNRDLAEVGYFSE